MPHSWKCLKHLPPCLLLLVSGEDVIEAVEREVFEETGVKVKFECVIAVRQVIMSSAYSVRWKVTSQLVDDAWSVSRLLT